jgi:ABC-2 type transport system ATP-binding protein
VSVSYANTTILDQISLQADAGETIGLLGLNGAGKSTFLKMLAGINVPDTGTIKIAGVDLGEAPLQARSLLGYAPDKPPLYPDYTVEQFLKFAGRLRRIPRRHINAATVAAIERCGLGEVRRRIIGNLSHGFQQRVNLAQALIHQPALLLLDEPLNGLDPAQIAAMREILADVGESQTTLYSSHQLVEVQATCDRAIVIHNGAKLLDSDLGEVASKDQTTIEIHLEDTATTPQMQSLPGVLSAASVTPDHWMLTTRTGSTTLLREALKAHHIRWHEISLVRNHLERVFNLLAGQATAGATQ